MTTMMRPSMSIPSVLLLLLLLVACSHKNVASAAKLRGLAQHDEHRDLQGNGNANGMTPLIEQHPCVPYDKTSAMRQWSFSHVQCKRENGCTNGCCRLYHWLVCDTDNQYPSIACVCNANTASNNNNRDYDTTTTSNNQTVQVGAMPGGGGSSLGGTSGSPAPPGTTPVTGTTPAPAESTPPPAAVPSPLPIIMATTTQQNPNNDHNDNNANNNIASLATGVLPGPATVSNNNNPDPETIVLASSQEATTTGDNNNNVVSVDLMTLDTTNPQAQQPQPQQQQQEEEEEEEEKSKDKDKEKSKDKENSKDQDQQQAADQAANQGLQPWTTTILETQPCVDYESTARKNRALPLSDAECLIQGGCTNGCCRLYDYLVCDVHNAFPGFPCVCNANTKPKIAIGALASGPTGGTLSISLNGASLANVSMADLAVSSSSQPIMDTTTTTSTTGSAPTSTTASATTSTTATTSATTTAVASNAANDTNAPIPTMTNHHVVDVQQTTDNSIGSPAKDACANPTAFQTMTTFAEWTPCQTSQECATTTTIGGNPGNQPCCMVPYCLCGTPLTAQEFLSKCVP